MPPALCMIRSRDRLFLDVEDGGDSLQFSRAPFHMVQHPRQCRWTEDHTAVAVVSSTRHATPCAQSRRVMAVRREDPIVTSFDGSLARCTGYESEDYGSDLSIPSVEVDAVALAQAENALSSSAEYGSDADWNLVTIGRETTIITANSNYGSDFDSDGERQLATLATAASLEFNSLHPVVKPLSSQASRTSGTSHYYSCREELSQSSTLYTRRAPASHSQVPNISLGKDEKPKENEPTLNIEFAADEQVPTEPAIGGVEDPRLAIRGISKQAPLKRFRGQRPLTVTDFAAPAWCELQYYLSLNKYGKLRTTEHMRRGRVIHKELEKDVQLQDYEEVSVLTREDGWGLNIWMVIQGLRLLRGAGVTRELRVWGVINGQVVAGVIDELSSNPPGSDSEVLNDFLGDDGLPAFQKVKEANPAGASDVKAERDAKAKIYISDTKTRKARNLPNDASARPARVQLMLYHYLVTLLSNKKVDGKTVFHRYGLEPNQRFSKPLMNQIAESDYNISAAVTNEDSEMVFSTPSQTLEELELHSTLEELWDLMLDEYAKTFQPDLLSSTLYVSYRLQQDKSHLGWCGLKYNDDALKRYMNDTMDWWAGDRPAKGVEIEEAFKCQTCDFAGDCSWRLERHQLKLNGLSIQN